MKTSHSLIALSFTLAVAALVSARAAAPTVEETVVGPVGAGGLYVISQNDARVAYVGAKGTRTVVSVDGVEGPVLDELFNGSAAFVSAGGALLLHNANAGGVFNGLPTAVIFSESGSHFSYIGRQGNDYVVIHDGKEVGRGPRNALALQHLPLGLSPKGNFAFWGEMKTEGGRGQYRLVVDGHAEPWTGHQELKPVFSADERRYAYNAGTVEDYQKQMLIVDGKVAGYTGHTPQFTADSKVLLTILPAGNNVVLAEGKPVVSAGLAVEKVAPGPVGGRYAVILRKRTVNYEGVGTLYLDGREVPGTDGAMDISFSPDGQHYALRCKNPEAHSFFVIIDGKKGAEYQGVAEKFSWSPDSSKVAYQINSSGRNFVVVNTEEFAVQSVGSLTRDPIVFAKTGARFAFSSGDNLSRQYLTVVDGKNVLPAGLAPNGDTFDFSDNGAHYAMVASPAGRNDFAGLIIDGVLNTDLAISSFGGSNWITPTRNPFFLWSGDGKYLARMARRPDNSAAGLYLNDQLAYPSTMGVSRPTFSPDSRHFFWQAAEKFPDRAPPYYVAYADGTAVVKMSGDAFLGNKSAWVVDDKGVLTFIGAVGDSVKRFRVTPAADMDIDKVVAQAAVARQKADEEAAAAKAKLEKEKADAAAQAKAAADAAAAKRKADLAAAAAARQQARQDALYTKKLNQLNAQRAKKGLPPLTELPDSP